MIECTTAKNEVVCTTAKNEVVGYITLVTCRHLMFVLLLQKVLLSCCSRVVWSPPSSYHGSSYSGITLSLRMTLISGIVLELSSLSMLLQTGQYAVKYKVTFSHFGPHEINNALLIKHFDKAVLRDQNGEKSAEMHFGVNVRW